MEINKQTAKRLYDESPEWFKNQLKEEFGQDISVKKDFEKIKTFEDACKKIKIKPEEVFNDKDTPDEIAYKKLKVIIKAINNGWELDWNNTNQKKWWPWFNLSSGFGFSLSSYYYTYTSTYVGSRLCFQSEEKSDYTAIQFIDLYEQFLTIKSTKNDNKNKKDN